MITFGNRPREITGDGKSRGIEQDVVVNVNFSLPISGDLVRVIDIAGLNPREAQRQTLPMREFFRADVLYPIQFFAGGTTLMGIFGLGAGTVALVSSIIELNGIGILAGAVFAAVGAAVAIGSWKLATAISDRRSRVREEHENKAYSGS